MNGGVANGTDILIVCAVGWTSGGNTRSTVMKHTHATATMPMGIYHLPSENGPLCSLSRPVVIRRNIGVT